MNLTRARILEYRVMRCTHVHFIDVGALPLARFCTFRGEHGALNSVRGAHGAILLPLKNRLVPTVDKIVHVLRRPKRTFLLDKVRQSARRMTGE